MAQLNARLLHRIATSAEWAATDVENAGANLVLLKGEMGIEILPDNGGTKTKIGDGISTWAQLEYSNKTPEEINSLVSGAEKNAKDYADELVANLDIPTGGAIYKVSSLDEIAETPENGDIAIVTSVIAGDKTSLTAYVFDATADEGKGAWAAFDGNYSAENVFTSSAITLAGDYGSYKDSRNDTVKVTQIGNKKIGDVIPAGTSMQDLWKSILTQTIQPTKTNPSASISASGDDGGKEVGSSYTLPTATLTVNTGSYTNEGVNTGVSYAIGDVTIAYGADPDAEDAPKVSNASVLGNGGTVKIAPATYSADATTALYTDDSVSYTFSGKAGHSAGNVAKDNLGGDSNPVVQIAANENLTIADKTVSFRGFRKMFCGCTTSALSSSVIRGLSLKSAQASTTAFEVTAPIGATNLVVACPTKSVGKKYTLSKAEMFTMSYEDYTAEFKAQDSVDVADYRGGENGLQAYNIYVYSFAALKAATKFRITLKSANA